MDRNLDRAEILYRQALKREPHFGPASVNLADLLARAGKFKEAKEALETAIAKVPNDPGLYHAYGLLLIRTDRREEGFRAIEKAQILAPGSLRYTYVYAIALHDFGRTPEAIRVLETAAKKWPSSSLIRQALIEYRQFNEK